MRCLQQVKASGFAHSLGSAIHWTTLSHSLSQQGQQKPLNNKSTQTPTDREADLDIDVKPGFDKTSQRLFFLLGGHQTIGKEHLPCISLCSLLDFSPPKFPMPSFDAPFGNSLSCLGCFTVSPICSDYRHTEWTGCSSAWLHVANVDWHLFTHPSTPWATTSVLKVLFLVLFCFLFNTHGLPENPSHDIMCSDTCIFMINRKSSLTAERSRRASICAEDTRG